MSELFESIAMRGKGLWLLIGRLAMGSLFLPTGLRKLLQPENFAVALAKYGMIEPHFAWAVVAGVVEFFGAAAVIIGFQTRAAALLMALFTIVAAFLGHQFWLLEGPDYVAQLINFWKDLAIAGGFLILFCRGAGPLSADRR
jgi:putative oxidoreductase